MNYIVDVDLPSLTVIMPCLNEERNVKEALLETIDAFAYYGIKGNIIVINDGSADHTAKIVSEISESLGNISLLNHEAPKGIGASFWHGVQEANGDYVILMPGDNENDPIDALRYFYLTRDVDVIIPFIMNLEVRSKFRRIVSSLYRLIINISFGMSLNYTNGTVIYNRKILNNIDLNTTGFLYQSEILIKLIRAGYFYAETPHVLSIRGSGKSKALTIKSLGNVIKGYLSMIWMIHFSRTAGRLDQQLHPDSISAKRSISQ